VSGVARANRTGGELLAECLTSLGADVVFGLPGIHALPAWEGLRRRRIPSVVMRTELSAGFAADGYARSTGRPAPLLLSTGPGALNSMTALMEAASSHVPVVAVVSQIPRHLVGRRRGYLHELQDQLASFAPIVKWTVSVPSLESLPSVMAAAWSRARTAPTGPVVVEVPVDLLGAETAVPEVSELDGSPGRPPRPESAALAEATALLWESERPVLWAGGGVLRAEAWAELLELAELLDSPVATTYMGKGAFPSEHPLSVGCCCDEGAFRELLEDADVLVCVGTELGAETTQQYALAPRGRLIQIDAAPERLGASYRALGLSGDAGEVLRLLAGRLRERPRPQRRDGPEAVAALRRRVAAGLSTQRRTLEAGLLASIGAVLPDTAVQAWDMTILGYWAAPHHRAPAPRRFLYPLGSGTLGYAWPAALGASVGLPGTPVLAVVGDGGFSYGAAELAAARQYGLRAALLLVDDGGYGILREYQMAAFGVTHEVDLIQPDLAAVAAAAGVAVRTTTPDALADDLSWALAEDGPAVVVLKERLVAAAPTP
jgi:acetolactate synthase-1/2/3 large subunit